MVSFLCFLVFTARWYVDPERYVDPSGIRLEGDWSAKVGVSPMCGDDPCWASGVGWTSGWRVEVPRPLLGQLPQEKRHGDIWLRKTVRTPEPGDPLALSLGSIKGHHTVWLNGRYLGSGGDVAFGFYRIPEGYAAVGMADIVVRIGASESPWRGIVHMSPMQIGSARILSGHERDYQFQTIAKPLFPVVFKLSLFLVFAALFVFLPIRREYMWFAVYSFASGLAALGYWRLHPLYENFHLRSLFVFVCEMAATAAIPLFVAEFLRLNRGALLAAAAWGTVLLGASSGALLLVPRASWPGLFQRCYELMPWVSLLPSAGLALFVAGHLWFIAGVRHRAMQVGVLSVCLLATFFHKAALSGALFQFLLVRYPEALDAGIFTAMSALMVADFRGLQGVWLRSRSALPAEVARLAASGARHALVKSDAVIVVVDAVGYTKQIECSSPAERDELNQSLKDALAPVVLAVGGEKISDTGDGSVYRWEMGEEDGALYAAAKIAALEISGGKLRFRVGVAAGSITCHYRDAEFSYLGEPINRASRLQSAAEPGAVLVDESVTLPDGFIAPDCIPYLIKGQKYLARPLGVATGVVRVA
ncbi:MAG: hypothetical protein HUU37_06675 [Bdellovibrionales bacterium]|nr:hypothetical protein [Bdellovibrionales bacterium]